MPWTKEVKPSVNVTKGKEHVESREDTISLLSIMWSEAPDLNL